MGNGRHHPLPISGFKPNPPCLATATDCNTALFRSSHYKKGLQHWGSKLKFKVAEFSGAASADGLENGNLTTDLDSKSGRLITPKSPVDTQSPYQPVCPVPAEQQPLNEYQDLRESWFFRWGVVPLRAYLTTIAWVWGLSSLISVPVAAASFPPLKYPTHFALSAAAGSGLIVLFLLVRLYLGWVYVRDRLRNETISYEESGWYDGQMWQKTPTMLSQDRLVADYQVKPILQRLHRTFGVLLVLVLTGCLVWAVA